MTDQKNSEPQKPHADQRDLDAIAAIIRAETVAFHNKDYTGWQRCWAQDDRVRDVYISSTTGLTVLSGWPAICRHMKKVFDSGLSARMVEFRQEDLQINVIGNCAWAVFNTRSSFENDEHGESFDTRVLERQNDGWKLVYSSFVWRQYKGPEGLVLGLDRNGMVLHSSPASLHALKSHPYLMVSHGQLRAHRRDWDRALQKALGQASQHHGFFETYRFSARLGGPAQYPVVLGATDEGGVAVVRFSIRDGVTYLCIDAHQSLDRHLKVARTVFSLSEGQLKVARQIAMGASLKDAAAMLGVSVNTARTHLSRLYEKTGVRTQAALVRLLLSVG